MVATEAARVLAGAGSVVRSLTATPHDRRVRALRGAALLAAGVAVVTADADVVRAAGFAFGALRSAPARRT